MPSRKQLFFLGLVIFSLIILEPLWFPLATGMILAFLCEGPTYKIFRRWQLERARSKFLVAFAFVSLLQGVFLVPMILISWKGVQELVNFLNGQAGQASAWENWQKTQLWLDHIISPWLLRSGIDLSFADLIQRLQAAFQPVMQATAILFGSFLGSAPQLILFGVITWMAWVYFLVHGRRHRARFLPLIIPWEEERLLLCETMAHVLRSMVLTSVILAIIQAILVTLTLGMGAIPKFYLWGVGAFFLSFIPLFGTAPLLIGSALYCYNQDRQLAALLIVVMSVVIGLSDNILRPFLMKGTSEQSFFWLFLSIVGGASLLGLPGIILGPWAFALFQAVQDPKRGYFNSLK